MLPLCIFFHLLFPYEAIDKKMKIQEEQLHWVANK